MQSKSFIASEEQPFLLIKLVLVIAGGLIFMCGPGAFVDMYNAARAGGAPNWSDWQWAMNIVGMAMWTAFALVGAVRYWVHFLCALAICGCWITLQ